MSTHIREVDNLILTWTIFLLESRMVSFNLLCEKCKWFFVFHIIEILPSSFFKSAKMCNTHTWIYMWAFKNPDLLEFGKKLNHVNHVEAFLSPNHSCVYSVGCRYHWISADWLAYYHQWMTPGGEKHFLNLITLFELFLRDKHTIFAEKIKSRAPTLNFVENTLA